MLDTDWRQVELDYRAGVMSINNVCAIHGITRQRLMERVASDGWSRDLMSQVRAEVNERLYMNRRHEAQAQDHVSAAAQVMVEAVYRHRHDIAHLRSTVSRTIQQVNDLLDMEVTDDKGDLDRAELILRNVRSSLLLGKTQGIVNALDVLASAYQRVITMERAAFGLDSLVSTASYTQDSESNVPTATVQLYLPANHRDPVTA